MPVVSSVFARFQGAGFAKATWAAGGRPSRGEEKPGPCVQMTVVSQLRYLRKTSFQVPSYRRRRRVAELTRALMKALVWAGRGEGGWTGGGFRTAAGAIDRRGIGASHARGGGEAEGRNSLRNFRLITPLSLLGPPPV